MLKAERISVMNLENAVRGARNPMNSWARMDSYYDDRNRYVLGPQDLDLCRRLARAGSDHRKFMRQIMVSMDITAPLYWWKDFDTYKVGTVANSTSTMHKLHARPIVRDDFSCERLTDDGLAALDALIAFLEVQRQRFTETHDIACWHNLIQLLPSSYNQMRTVSMNYEVLVNIYYARRTHKLPEWHTLCDAIRALPYATDLILCRESE